MKVYRDFLGYEHVDSDGAFKDFFFHSIQIGNGIQFDEHIFQLGLVQPPTNFQP